MLVSQLSRASLKRFQKYYSCSDPSIEVLFSDQHCYNNIRICPSDTANVTCNAYESKQRALGVTIQPDESPNITIFYYRGSNQIIPEGKVTVVSKRVQSTNEMFNYEITMSITGSDLSGSPVVCSDSDYNDSSTCKIAGDVISPEIYVIILITST